MTITAKYPGKCKKCGAVIHVGERIEWEKTTGASHVKCPDGHTAQNGPKKTGQLWEECPRCGREPVYMPLHLCERCWPKTREIKPTYPPIEPYRLGIGQGFGPGEDGDPDVE